MHEPASRQPRGERPSASGVLPWLLALIIAVVASLLGSLAHARPLTSSTLNVVGVEGPVGPATQSVPKGLTSVVTSQLVTPAASIPIESILGLLPGNLLVKGELSGPAFATPLTLSASAGQPLTLPTLPLLGTCTLKHLRLSRPSSAARGRITGSGTTTGRRSWPMSATRQRRLRRP